MTAPRVKPELTPLAERVRLALQLVFHGHQSDMAAAFNVSHSMISRIVRGLQQPGHALIGKLALRPEIESHWLYTGEGSMESVKAASSSAPRDPVTTVSKKQMEAAANEVFASLTEKMSRGDFSMTAAERMVMMLLIYHDNAE